MILQKLQAEGNWQPEITIKVYGLKLELLLYQALMFKGWDILGRTI